MLSIFIFIQSLSINWIINLGENPTIKTMFNFFKQMKQKLSSSQHPKQPTYRQYTHGQLKIIAMRTRMVLQQIYKKEKMKVGQKDSQFKKLQIEQTSIEKQYEVLQQIGQKVIQVQSIKLLMQMLRKIQSYSPQIINTKGDISLLKQQLQWFQCILWYRRCKKLTTIQQFNTFCFNFFKGVDITQQLNMKCELFNVYEELKYLQSGQVIPMDYLVKKVVGEVSFQITEEEMEGMREINSREIKEREMVKRRDGMREGNTFIQYGQQQSFNPQQQYTNNPQQQPQQQQPYPYINPNPFPPYNNINNPQTNYNQYPQPLDNTTSQLPFLSPKEQPKPAPIINKKPLDDEFAMDMRYTRRYQSSAPITPIVPPVQQPQKQFKSSQLNLIDWQSMYPSSNSHSKPQQSNPYINNSHIGLLDDEHWTSSQSNSYDAASLPYPPSGVIPMSDVKYRPDNKLYVDTLQKYQSQPVIREQQEIYSGSDSSNKGNKNSFIEGIQSKFFVNTNANRQQGKQQQLSEDELLLREIERQSVEINKQQQVKQQQKPKSFNKLFGMKMKTSNPLPVIEPSHTIPQQPTHNKQHQQEFPSLDLQQFISSSTKPPQYEQSIVKQLQQDEIEQYLKQHHNEQQHQQNDSNQLTDIERQLSRVDIGKQDGNHNQEQEQSLNHDIKTLIQTRKQEMQRQQSCDYMYSSDEEGDNKDQHTKPNENNLQSQQHQHTTYPVDNQRLDSSAIRYSQQALCQSNTHYQQQQQQQKESIDQYHHNPYQELGNNQPEYDYVDLDADLLDSLNIIRKHFGHDVATNQQKQQTKTPQSSLSIKKPYMVSIYARQNYLDSLTQIKKKLSSPK